MQDGETESRLSRKNFENSQKNSNSGDYDIPMDSENGTEPESDEENEKVSNSQNFEKKLDTENSENDEKLTSNGEWKPAESRKTRRRKRNRKRTNDRFDNMVMKELKNSPSSKSQNE